MVCCGVANWWSHAEVSCLFRLVPRSQSICRQLHNAAGSTGTCWSLYCLMLTLLVPHSFIPHPLTHSLTPSPTPSTPHPLSHSFTPSPTPSPLPPLLQPLTTTYRQWHRQCLNWFLPYPWTTVRMKPDYDISKRKLWDLNLSSHK